MLERVISGGQTGADQAGLRAARACGISTGGWAPRDWLTEDRPAPWLADYGLDECPEGESYAESYRARRRRCLMDSDAVLLFGAVETPGSRGLIGDVRAQGKPWLWFQPGFTTPRHAVAFMRDSRVSKLMIAGNRESGLPGIGERVERFLIVVFKSLAGAPTPPARACGDATNDTR